MFKGLIKLLKKLYREIANTVNVKEGSIASETKSLYRKMFPKK